MPRTISWQKLTHIARYNANIAGHVVKSPSGAFSRENGHSCSPGDEEAPLVGVGVPVHLAKCSRGDVKMRGGNGLGNRKVSAVHDPGFSSTALFRGSLEHVVGVLVLGLLECFGRFLFNAVRQ